MVARVADRPAVGARAWFGWAAVALSPPFLLESYTVFPDGPGAAIVPHGFWALLRAEWEREARDTRRRRTRSMLRVLRCSWPWPSRAGAGAAAVAAHAVRGAGGDARRADPRAARARTPNPMAKAIAFLAVPARQRRGVAASSSSSTARSIRPPPYGGEPAELVRVPAERVSAAFCSIRASGCSRPRRCSPSAFAGFSA